jgi:hypothetical protein
MLLDTIDKTQYTSMLPLLHEQVDPKYFYPNRYYSVSEPNDGYASSADGGKIVEKHGLEHFMLQKREIIHSKIGMLFSEIYQRYRLREENLYQISLDQCTCRTLSYALGDHVWDRRKIDLERKIIDLEQEKRREQTSFFRDILFLRKELRESLIEKLEEEQKAGLLTSQKEVSA